MRLLDDDEDARAYGDEELDLSSREDRGRLVQLVNQSTLWDDPDALDEEDAEY